jgi:hypothetical protein
MALPQHPGQDDESPVRQTTSRGIILVIAAGATLIVLMVVLHLTGVIGGG